MVYGEERLNHHNILKYGLTKEFIESFRALRYRNIEIPLTINRYYHVFIQRFIDRNLNNLSLIHQIQRKHQISSIRQVQRALLRSPKVVRSLAEIPHRKTIIMPARLASFALEQLPGSNVILVVSNPHDRKALQGMRLPKNFVAYNYQKAVSRVPVSTPIKKQMRTKIEKIVAANRNHPIFSQPQFKTWLYKLALKSIKAIHALDLLIRKKPIGVIIDHVEIVNPGATLGLLAQKYNLPFINIPQFLITDRSLIPTRATHYCVWGKNYRSWLSRRGIPLSKIRIVGNIRFEKDRSKLNQCITKNKLLEKLHLAHLPPDQLIITYTTQPFDNKVNRSIMDWIRHVSNKLDSVTFLIRPHPFDKFNYRPYTKSSNIVLTSNIENLYDILKNTDIVMTISSNTAIEAALCNKGIIVLQPYIPYDFDHHNNSFNAHLSHASAGLTVNNKKELYNAVDKLCSDQDFYNELITKGKIFLHQTLHISQSASVLIRRLIRKILTHRK